MAIAMCDSVTVSMAALMIGMFSRMLREIWVCVLVLRGHDFGARRQEQHVVKCEGFRNWKMDHRILD